MLSDAKTLPASGIVVLAYAVPGGVRSRARDRLPERAGRRVVKRRRVGPRTGRSGDPPKTVTATTTGPVHGSWSATTMPATRTTTKRTATARAKRRRTARARPHATIDEYLTGLRPDQSAAVQRLRTSLRPRPPAPKSASAIGSRRSACDGQGSSGLARAPAHSAIYGVSEAYPGQFAGYDTSGKGTLRFPLDEPVPAALVRELVKARMQKIAAKAKATAAAKPASRSRGG